MKKKALKKVQKFLPGPGDKIRLQISWVPRNDKHGRPAMARIQGAWLLDMDVVDKIMTLLPNNSEIKGTPFIIPLDDEE